MSPRPYVSTRRRAAADETRTRIILAVREVLLSDERFTMDAVAARANVARMTLYYQFGSRRGLLEALFDHVATGTLVPGLPEAMRHPDPLKALQLVVKGFCGLWASETELIRRLRGLAVTDPELDESLSERDRRRRGIGDVLAGRLAEKLGRARAWRDEASSLIFTMTGFPVYLSLREVHEPAVIERQLVRWITKALDLPR